MELFRMEHKKLWRKAIVKICVLICFAYVVIFGSILSFQWFNLGSMSGYETGFGNNFDGYSVIRSSQEYTAPFRGNLTDETVQQLVRDYQRMYNADMVADSQKTDYMAVNTWLQMLWPEEKDSSSYNQMITYVNPDRLTGLYERREQALNDFLENSNQTGDEKAYIMEMEEDVDKPFYYDWTRGWSALLGDSLPDLGFCLAPFIAIVLSSLFSGEWHDRTASLVLTMKNGWKEIAGAKICTGLVFTAELFALLMSGLLVSQLFFLGTDGWNMPIQNIKMLAVAPMNMLQAEIYELAFALLGAIGYAGIVMLASATVKSNVLALLLSLAVVYVPPILMNYCPLTIQKALELIPLVGSSADIFRTNTYHILGRYLWSPYLLISVPVLIGILCIPFAIKNWAKRLKA